MSEKNADPAIAVCVCTYRRPRQLGRLLQSLLALKRGPSTFFVIVDNDGADQDVVRAVDDFRAASGSQVKFAIEPRPGISAARNRAIALAKSNGAHVVAMLDDDATAPPDWLDNLLETQHSTGASIVGGPVLPVFPDGHAKPAREARLWSVTKGKMRGRTYVYCTCNCLFELSAVSLLGDAPFDERFGLTGGEDAVFFRKLFFAGVSMAWSDAATLREEFPPERATTAWIRRRWYRQGHVGVDCERAAPDPNGLPPLVKTLLLCGRLAIYPFFNRDSLSAPLLWLLESDRVRGRIDRHLGIAYAEYGR